MKFLAFVDMHGSNKAFHALKKKIINEKPDFIVCAGDFTVFEHAVKSILHAFSKFKLKLFLVHGNHEEEKVVAQVAKHYSNIEFVHSKVIEYNGAVIVGWGGGGFTERDVEFEGWARKIKNRLKQYKKDGKKIIFVSHAPPYKTKLDHLWKGHHGNKSFSRFIKELKIDVAISGHLHENSGKEDSIDKSRVYNPGQTGKIIEL
jgi:uncharacterized protein